MNTTSLTQLVPILQLAIGPVILISGVALLLLTMTNRFGRLVDRLRLLHGGHRAEARGAAPAEQIAILERRAGILRHAIILGSTTVLLVALLILVLFVTALLQIEAGWLIVTLFCLSLLSLIGSVVAFIHDMNLALAAVRLELRR
jgi:hypothetical protein